MTEAAKAIPRLSYRIPEAAQRIGISVPMVYKLVAAGKLGTVKIGRCTVVTESALQGLLKKRPP